ncbi:TonB-dependent receptor domain-containing protein [Saccharicrinis sp. FJH54]|uniref:TonB-dependent receptor n=1 Tax=Saccharicrinis sp. FJH54 TaxID=3344665 RepID=UPI0035D4FBFF
MTRRIFSLLMILTFTLSIHASELTQNIRGKIIDEVTGYPIPGANVILIGTEPVVGTTTDANGYFNIPDVPVGRQSIRISFIGYESRTISNLLLSSAKETFMEIKLTEKVTSINEVTVKSFTKKEEALNEMAMISSRSFSVEETERFAGSLGDPARMVANYAGVMTQNDSRNDIIIRGNSPTGVQWRLENMEIPNPNHFGALGTTGGPVSMLNNNLLTNSDFLTGAFPAEFGNVLSGVFDLNMRSGNNLEHEYTGQIGFNGFELGAEGPFKRKENGQNATYLANFRYSTLEVLDLIGFGVGTGSAIPQYKDLTFIVDLPGTKLGRFKLIGLWGDSFIDLGREETDTAANNYNPRGTATDFGSKLGFIGLNHTYFINENSRFLSTVSYQYLESTTKFDSIQHATNTTIPQYRGTLYESKASATTEFKQKINTKNNYSIGVIYDHYFVNFNDSAMSYNQGHFITTQDTRDDLNMLRAYAQWQHNFNNRLTGYAGLYSQYFDLNGESSVEPRASLRYRANHGQTFTLGYGRHSQIQPKSIYFAQTYHSSTNTYTQTNHDVKFSKADHIVLGYNNMLSNNFRIKAEMYYQHLFHIPIKDNPQNPYEAQFSLVNAGDFFALPTEDNLVNKGLGRNYGIELTLEKFLSKGYYVLFTTSIFDSKYKAADNVWRNTAFNGNYVFNLLGGYERKLSEKVMVTVDLKTVLAGGRRYVPIDLTQSIAKHETVYNWNNAWKNKFDDYFRTDVRFGIKLNGKKTSQEWAIDLQNVSGYQSIFMQGFDADKKEIYEVYQQGFYPMFLYRIQF